ncbi:MAG: hypothetical protein LH702_23325 [Phormidesmis sp. CAN_BIN44]|nr:hypothetical protein [Phormidesmis sp. CAN_BIN44]
MAGLTIAAIASGIIPMVYYRLKYNSSFYSESLEQHGLPEEQDLLKVI